MLSYRDSCLTWHFAYNINVFPLIPAHHTTLEQMICAHKQRCDGNTDTCEWSRENHKYRKKINASSLSQCRSSGSTWRKYPTPMNDCMPLLAEPQRRRPTMLQREACLFSLKVAHSRAQLYSWFGREELHWRAFCLIGQQETRTESHTATAPLHLALIQMSFHSVNNCLTLSMEGTTKICPYVFSNDFSSSPSPQSQHIQCKKQMLMWLFLAS